MTSQHGELRHWKCFSYFRKRPTILPKRKASKLSGSLRGTASPELDTDPLSDSFPLTDSTAVVPVTSNQRRSLEILQSSPFFDRETEAPKGQGHFHTGEKGHRDEESHTEEAPGVWSHQESLLRCPPEVMEPRCPDSQVNRPPCPCPLLPAALHRSPGAVSWDGCQAFHLQWELSGLAGIYTSRDFPIGLVSLLQPGGCEHTFSLLAGSAVSAVAPAA